MNHMYSLSSGDMSRRHSHEAMFAKSVCSYNCVQRESMASGDRPGQDMRSMVPAYANNKECFAIF